MYFCHCSRGKTVVYGKNRFWPTLYLSDNVLRIYSANLNLLITSLTVPRRRKLKTEIFSLKIAGKSGKLNNGFRVVRTDNTLLFIVLRCFSRELWSFKFNFIHRLSI